MIWTEENCKYIIDNYENYTIKELAENLNTTPDSVRNIVFRLQKKGILRKKHSKMDSTVKNYLIKTIKSNPNNLQDCFRKTADKFNIPKGSISLLWYGNKCQKRKALRDNCGVLFSVLGNRGTYNRKICKKGNTRSTHHIFDNIKMFIIKLFR